MNVMREYEDVFPPSREVIELITKLGKDYLLFKRVTEARDDLLAARERRKQARLAWGNACKNASIIDAQGRWLPKFVFDDEYDSYRATADFVKVAPWYLEGDFVDNNECFIAWYAAGKEKHEANKAHGIALRRLLQIGVKK